MGPVVFVPIAVLKVEVDPSEIESREINGFLLVDLDGFFS